MDFHMTPVIPITRSQIQSEEDNEISPMSRVISVPVVNNDCDLDSGDNSGLHSPDQVITSAIGPSHSGIQARPTGYLIWTSDQTSKQIRFTVVLCKLRLLLRKRYVKEKMCYVG